MSFDVLKNEFLGASEKLFKAIRFSDLWEPETQGSLNMNMHFSVCIPIFMRMDENFGLQTWSLL